MISGIELYILGDLRCFVADGNDNTGVGYSKVKDSHCRTNTNLLNNEEKRTTNFRNATFEVIYDEFCWSGVPIMTIILGFVWLCEGDLEQADSEN